MNVQALTKSWLPTSFGFAAGVLAYFASLGPNLPETGHDWAVAGFSAMLAGLGLSSKQFNVSHAALPVEPRSVDATTLTPLPQIGPLTSTGNIPPSMHPPSGGGPTAP